MTRGGDKDIEEGLRKFLDTRKGGSAKIRRGSKNLYTSKPTGGEGLLKKLNQAAREGGLLKFQYLHPPPLVILNELSLSIGKHVSQVMCGKTCHQYV